MSAPVPNTTGGEEEEEDEQQMDVSFIQGFADKIQRVPVELLDDVETSRPKVSIPKRGEKDFEPMKEAVNLQEMLLQSSRQALFDALQGVRGVASKSLSHAIITPSSSFPRLIVSRGHVLDSLGITVRRVVDGKLNVSVELLPEEALYLVERGSLQIWNGRDAVTDQDEEEGVGSWCDEEFGVKGAVELSVMEAFGVFMGKEGLTWQRYQAYAYLKRLGYTVQRSRQFIPRHFLASPAGSGTVASVGLGQGLRNFCMAVRQGLASCLSSLSAMYSRAASWFSERLPVSRLPFLSGYSYSSLFSRLRFVPAGHHYPVPEAPKIIDNGSIYQPLGANPYLPFFHVWKPVTGWSKAKWDRGSPVGLEQQPPDYYLAVVESRDTPLPTLWQLDAIFNDLPDEVQGATKKVGPQYQKRPPRPERPAVKESFLARWLPWLSAAPAVKGNAMGALRNGDRGLIVAVNDSGNTGWVRFGRSGFEAWPMV